MKRGRILLFFCVCLAINTRVKANDGGSPLEHFRLNDGYRKTDIIWDANYAWYLGQKRPGMATTLLFHPVRILNNNWEIIRFDPSTELAELEKYYQTLVPSNDLWKYSGALEPLRLAGSWPASRICRVSFSDAESYLRFVNSNTVYKTYPDYRTADIVVANPALLGKIASDTNIIFIGLANGNAHTEQAVKRLDYGVNNINVLFDRMPSMNGKNTTVSIKENLFDTTDIDFKNRYLPTSLAAKMTDEHAGVIATMVGGSGNSYYTGKGVANATRLASADFGNLMPEPLAYYQQNQVDVQNHSYGTGVENEYAADAAAYDLTTWTDTTLLHVFSAGNSGTATAGLGNYAGIEGYANLTGSFKMSKNSLAIGGTDSFYHTEILSSRGPAYDGRVKPELVAFGIDGTSGAAALVSGTALVLQQAVSERTGKKASAALVKALLITGSDDLGSEGPDFITGYGSLNSYRSLQIANSPNWYTAAVDDDKAQEYLIQVPPNTARVKMTLAWTDTPATLLAARAIMNDLDIELIATADLSIIHPWILSTKAAIDSLKSPAIRGIDSLNTVEVISMLHPAPGNYIIKVSAGRLLTSQQSFAVTWHFEPADSIEINYPTKTAVCLSEESEIVRWQSSYSNMETATLEYKLAGSAQWQLITDKLPVKQQWYCWQTPAVIAKAQVRITADSKIYTSDTFVISKTPVPEVGYDCADSFYLYWPKLAVEKYRVYNLGDTLMQPIALTADTFFKAKSSSVQSRYFAVAPVLDNREANRSYTIDYKKLGVGCYIENFIADLFGDSAVLTLTVGTNFNIDKVILQKKVNGTFIDLPATPSSQFLTYHFNDRSLLTGENTYRVKIVLKDGTTVYGVPGTVYYTGGKIYLFYPNPVKQHESLTIVNQFYDGDLFASLYDITGRLIRKLSLPAALNIVPVKDLPPGMYLFVFTDGKLTMGVEKLVVR